MRFCYKQNKYGIFRRFPSCGAAALLLAAGVASAPVTAYAEEASYVVMGGASQAGAASSDTGSEETSYVVVGGGSAGSSSGSRSGGTIYAGNRSESPDASGQQENTAAGYTAVDGRGNPVDPMPLGSDSADGLPEGYGDAGAADSTGTTDAGNAENASGDYAVVSANTDHSGGLSYADVAPEGAITEVSADYKAGNGTADAAAIASAEGVQYTNLRSLLVAGNASLRKNSTYSSIEDLEFQIGILEAEVGDMVMNKNQYKDDDPQTADEYARSANAMSSSLKQLRKRLNKLTSDTSSSLDESIDSMEMTAQTRFASYNRMAVQAEAKEKTLAAAEKTYQNTVLRYSAGAATEAQVASAYDRLLQQQNELESYRQQMNSLRRNLLSMFGLADTAGIVIGTMPPPDPAAIAAIDFASDRQKAIDNDASVQRVRHQSANSSAAMALKDQTEAEAIGAADASITDSYQQLQATLTEYQGAQAALSKAEQDYGALQRKKQAGMVTEADYLSGEASWLSANASFTSASIALKQAYDDYCWQVKGVS